MKIKKNMIWRFDKKVVHELMKKKEILVLPNYNYVYDKVLKAEIIANGSEIIIKTTYKGGREKFIEFLKTVRERYQLPKSIEIRVQTVREDKLRDLEEFYMLKTKYHSSVYWDYLNGKISLEEFSKYLK